MPVNRSVVINLSSAGIWLQLGFHLLCLGMLSEVKAKTFFCIRMLCLSTYFHP